MEVEIISVGNELILGQIVNTNVAYLADQLRQIDLVAHYQTTVDDEPERIIAAVRTAQKRAQLVFVCGGLGPTDDDQTMPSVAKALGKELVLDEDHWATIQANFERRHVTMTPENIRQAYYLADGIALANPVGLALGTMVTTGKVTTVVLPGPPSEFKAMVKQSLLPELKKQFRVTNSIITRNLHFVGQPESLLMDEITSTLGNSPVVATSYVQPAEIQVRLKVSGMEATVAKQTLDQAEARIIAREKQYYFGTGDGLNLAGEVVRLLRAKGYRITAAESLTGGLFQSTLCSVSGASNVFNGGFVTYAAGAKEKLVGVPATTIQKYGVVSAETATAMAEGARQAMDADLGVSFTGVAGPDALEGHPAGTVFVAIAQKNYPTKAWQLKLTGLLGRQTIRNQSVAQVLLALYHRLQAEN
ncbi:competence/damage-inducible protein A [Lactobacillus alvi]|uniref:Putative competence-damage inducible protein n=1 Tax=Limosilactobacillus alvi TaxID=990412 RepID=A0ABS2ELE6_9LACO|nr:competence/damage-inducible protein A [Limosilactobacillus alvi]MBM6753264.1 competence/damage-inducible protein A [Limosilactobacillus alvi]